MFVLLDKYEREGAIEQVDAMSFAIYYHDIIYSVLRPNNEERSAALAKRRLQQLAVPLELQKKVVEMIEATKEHGFSSKSDVNYLLDFDLAVLGESESAYQEYTKNIRKEFSLFPNVVYKPARRKVLETFLSKGEIYHTDRFKKSRQLQAENNIKYEIRMLES